MRSPTHPPLPADETARLEALRRCGLRAGELDATLDGLTQIAARVCGVSSAEINLVDADHVRFVAAQGMGTAGGTVPREDTFCTWTVLDRDRPLLVPDAAHDERFEDNPFVRDGIIGGYAGFPLLADGRAIGTMCVHDPAPFTLDAAQLDALAVLARAAQAHMTLRRHAGELAEQARTDPLTGCANRRAIDEALAREIARAERAGDDVAVLLLDLDHFKAYNDEHGHIAGDRLLQRATAAWRAQLRASDLLGRWGGEEFVVLLPDCAPGRAAQVAGRLLGAVPFGQTCSAGVAAWRAGQSSTDVVCRADAALYDAKRRGRARAVVAP